MRVYVSKLALVALAVLGAGCYGDACEEFPRICGSGGGAGADPGGGGEGGGEVGGNGANGGSGGDGGGGAPPAGCTPTEGQPIGADCGVFVQSGRNGDGTQGSPFGSVVDAVGAVGNGGRIYICGADSFNGSVALPSGVSIFGSLDCDDWSYSATNAKPTILGAQDVAAVTIQGEEMSTIQSIRIESPSGLGVGASSIALVVENATVDVIDSDIVANAGAIGPPGANESQTNALVGGEGHSGNQAFACGTGGLNDGGLEVVNVCPNGQSIGGMGGGSQPSQGSDGIIGEPMSGGLGAGGMGQPQVGAWSCSVGGTNGGGDAGATGGGGTPGTSGALKGALTFSGFTGDPGGAGGAGSPGQGGGGGGGAKGLVDCNGGTAGNQPQAGASGGSGGAGGCGGEGAAGGGGGGSSFALVSLGATITLTRVALTTSTGGTGGAGGLGQPGAFGGFGGDGGSPGTAQNGCSGGDGGQGGAGGGGGGGRGGHSAAIVFVGDPPTEVEGVTRAPGGAGGGGTGQGNGIDAGNNGLMGTSCELMDFNAEAEACVE
ncbi:MAG: hypothetical protein HOW73_32150 [Polyangiaceae bacterium]|nr:hypothetical protein [Polyangiaceae bacterium]